MAEQMKQEKGSIQTETGAKAEIKADTKAETKTETRTEAGTEARAAEASSADRAKAVFGKGDRISFYGDYRDVDGLDYTDYNDFVKNTESRQKLPGFEPRFRDIVDYILRITHEIWEERAIGVIYDTYHNSTIAHSCSTTSAGVVPVIAGTLSHLHAFPDRKIVAQSVVWSEDEPGYFFTSHRSSNSATNLGDSNFGPATGKKINFVSIADCAIHNNRIYEEWLVRDNLWVVKQLGLDPYEVARAMAAGSCTSGSPALKSAFGLNESVNGQLYPERYIPKDDSISEMLLAMHQNVYACKMLNEIPKYFHKNAKVHFICDKELCGREEIQGTLISFLASFPNAFHTVERITCNNTPETGTWNVALRWRLRGQHSGIGMFGNPTGKYVEIMGINHYRITDNKITESWMMFDGLDVLKQIVAPAEETEA